LVALCDRGLGAPRREHKRLDGWRRRLHHSTPHLHLSGTDHRLGATAGAGVEYGITPAISAKFEYLYITAVSLEVSHVNEVRAGVNYRFGGN
jgi:opacity protein-like surface antigen